MQRLLFKLFFNKESRARKKTGPVKQPATAKVMQCRFDAFRHRLRFARGVLSGNPALHTFSTRCDAIAGRREKKRAASPVIALCKSRGRRF